MTTKEKKQNTDDKRDISLATLLGGRIQFINEFDEVLEREVVAIGNGAHINIPFKHLGKKARVMILKKQEEERNKK